MNNFQEGKFKLDRYDFIISSDLSLSDFKAVGIPASIREAQGWTNFFFDTSIDGMSVEFSIHFYLGELHSASWFPKFGKDQEKWDMVPGNEQKQYLDQWLADRLGPPPYEYPWGDISVEMDIKSYIYGMGLNYSRHIQMMAEYREKRRQEINNPDKIVSAKKMLCVAFMLYQENPDMAVAITDQILLAATQLPKVNFTPNLADQLVITIGDDEPFEVGLPYSNISTFRMLLARIGVICDATAKKRSLVGKVKAFLMRNGVMVDKYRTEQKDGSIEYISAVIRDQPGSPLYKVDADLDVRLPNGTETQLHVMMQNSGHDLFLRIESRKGDSL